MKASRCESLNVYQASTLCRRALLVLAACSAMAAHCGPPPRPAYLIREPSTILQAIRARERRVRSLRARGSVEHFGREGRVRGSIVIYVQQPERMRVDTFAFGNLVSSMRSNGQRFTLLQGQRFYEGPARPCVAAQLLGIPMEAREVLAILSGGAPLLSERMTAPRWDDGRYVVEVQGEDGSSEGIELDVPDNERNLPPERQHLRVRRVVLRDRQGERATITYDGYRMVDGIPFPERVRIVMPRENTDTMLRFEEVDPHYTVPPPNPDIPDEAPVDVFSQDPPAGAERIPLTC